jgi:hypothetical protein
MGIADGFTYEPTTPLKAAYPTPPAPPEPPNPPAPPIDLGPLEGLVGTWTGTGLNIIWRPDQPASGSDHFLEINRTADSLVFDTDSLGEIPNRGLLQGDIDMTGLGYVQKVSDANLNEGLHFEPGVWLSVPSTSDPLLGPTVVRLASIPHGATIVAQGVATTIATAPTIPPVSITPFTAGAPTNLVPFPEQTLVTASAFRTAGDGLIGVTQAMLDNPNSLLGTPPDPVVSTTILQVSTNDSAPVIGGGTSNTAFLINNADAVRVDATFWLQTLKGGSGPTVLQYSQIVLLNFNGLSWPHVTVGSLTK